MSTKLSKGLKLSNKSNLIDNNPNFTKSKAKNNEIQIFDQPRKPSNNLPAEALNVQQAQSNLKTFDFSFQLITEKAAGQPVNKQINEAVLELKKYTAQCKIDFSTGINAVLSISNPSDGPQIITIDQSDENCPYQIQNYTGNSIEIQANSNYSLDLLWTANNPNPTQEKNMRSKLVIRWKAHKFEVVVLKSFAAVAEGRAGKTTDKSNKTKRNTNSSKQVDASSATNHIKSKPLQKTLNLNATAIRRNSVPKLMIPTKFDSKAVAGYENYLNFLLKTNEQIKEKFAMESLKVNGLLWLALADSWKKHKNSELSQRCTNNIFEDVSVALNALSMTSISAATVLSDNNALLQCIWQLVYKLDIIPALESNLLEEETALVSGWNHRYFNVAQSDYFIHSANLQSLLKWCQAICWAQAADHEQQITVTNFLSSFHSGAVIALIINYYWPSLLKRQEIQFQLPEATVSAVEESSGDMMDNKWRASYRFSDLTSDNKDATVLQLAKHNFRLINQVLSNHFPSIPLIFTKSVLSHSNTMDEKLVILFVRYLFTELTLRSRVIHAVKLIQRTFRYNRQKKHIDRVRKIEVRQQVANDTMDRSSQLAAFELKLNSFYGIKKRLINQRIDAEQADTVKVEEQKRFHSAVVLQSYVRMILAKKQLFRLKLADNSKQAQRKKLLLLQNKAAVQIQCLVRRRAARQQLMALRLQAQALLDLQHESALRIQAIFRAYAARKVYGQLTRVQQSQLLRQHCALNIQCFIRRSLARKAAKSLRSAKLTYEAQRNSSAITIQSAFRCYLARRCLSKLHKQRNEEIEAGQRYIAAAKLFDFFAMKLQQNELIHQLQAAALAYNQVRKDYVAHVTTAQSYVRGYLARSQYKQMKLIEQQQYLELSHHSATIIQNSFRCFIARKELAQSKLIRAQNSAAILIQRCVRRMLAGFVLLKLKQERIAKERAKREMQEAAAIILQRNCRIYLAKLELTELKQQQAAEKKRLAINSAVVKLQSALRRFLAQRQFKRMKLNHLIKQTQQQRVEFYQSLSDRNELERVVGSASILAKAARERVFQVQAKFQQLQRIKLSVAIKINKLWRGKKHRTTTPVVAAVAAAVDSDTAISPAPLSFQVETQSAIKIQSMARSFLARREYSRLRLAAKLKAIEAKKDSRVGWNRRRVPSSSSSITCSDH
jgi:hypothetical protein